MDCTIAAIQGDCPSGCGDELVAEAACPACGKVFWRRWIDRPYATWWWPTTAEPEEDVPLGEPGGQLVPTRIIVDPDGSTRWVLEVPELPGTELVSSPLLEKMDQRYVYLVYCSLEELLGWVDQALADPFSEDFDWVGRVLARRLDTKGEAEVAILATMAKEETEALVAAVKAFPGVIEAYQALGVHLHTWKVTPARHGRPMQIVCAKCGMDGDSWPHEGGKCQVCAELLLGEGVEFVVTREWSYERYRLCRRCANKSAVFQRWYKEVWMQR